MESALEFLEITDHSFVTKTLFILTHVKVKQGDKKSAKLYFEKGCDLVVKNNDDEYSAKFKILEGLYFSNGEYDLIREAFRYLDMMKMYADLENYAVDVADYFHQERDFQRSSEYYRLSVEARKKIKKGEVINENKPDSINSGGID
ncbi:hypothetical protein [Pseudomonas sp. ISL-88]|uniref:hypothetical protein n=1 Tax=Pseudomonas sp. ISL-88 TaxID=2819169 RepID=UPI0025708F05|nr:hypothetical protein [Pseudomonas sp. ISL-88]